MTEAYFIATALLVLCVSLSAIWRGLVPVSVGLAATIGYFSLDLFLGSPKPVGLVPGWHAPVFGDKGAKVLGGKIDGSDGLYLMLDEVSQPMPKLYRFPVDADMRRALKQAMEAHAKTANGMPWGFLMKDASGTMAGEESGEKGAGKPGSGHGHTGSMSLEDRTDNRWTFAEPQAEHMPDKDY